ncbi:conserved hypothetical protein [Synechococcus sp. CC9902]|uniref:DUF4278 domain-containing protein n=1 Tax=Synechococcus sp. (strain CC9902) TaxID=316279 RepID=UPI00005D4556|nr:DUF4278 domain-containing protein [Synechococcus sp. CC9902]ABB27226.1 conserved hypothetical protein [Synechococcus sp. CC9902]
MTSLLYRGHQYQQPHVTGQPSSVQLTYRRNIYKTLQQQAKSEHSVVLTYRGLQYVRCS